MEDSAPLLEIFIQTSLESTLHWEKKEEYTEAGGQIHLFLRNICFVYKHHPAPDVLLMCGIFWKEDKQRCRLGYTWSAPEASAAVSVCIRLWFPSVLCDLQSSQLILTAVACSGNHGAAPFSLSRGHFSHVFYSGS